MELGSGMKKEGCQPAAPPIFCQSGGCFWVKRLEMESLERDMSCLLCSAYQDFIYAHHKHEAIKNLLIEHI